MTSSRPLRNFIIGKDRFIEPRREYKTAMLIGELCLTSFLSSILFIASHAVLGLLTFWNGAIGFELLVASVASFVLNRRGLHALGSVLWLVSTNAFIFLYADRDPAANVHFIPISLAALSIYGHDKLKVGFLFSLASFGLFLLAYFYDFHTVRVFEGRVASIHPIVNYAAAFLISWLLLYFLLNLNHYSEKSLKQSQEKMSQQNALLVKTNAELDRFVYSASHDLRARLSSILGLINLSQKTTEPSEISKCLGFMREQVKTLDIFINEIQDYSRNSRKEIQTETIALPAFINEIQKSLLPSEKEDRVTFECLVPAGFNVVTDKSRLKIILTHVVGNSIKYSDPAKPHPTITVHSHADNEYIYVAVADNGQGIAEEHQPKIFDMFYRASESSHGSGLGLYIVKETVLKLGGEISVQSTLGVGSVFEIKLPK
jgi:signal transduction histidine kinase